MPLSVALYITGRTGALGLPTAQRVSRQTKFHGEIKTADPADQ
jgi:hypothetical protein